MWSYSHTGQVSYFQTSQRGGFLVQPEPGLSEGGLFEVGANEVQSWRWLMHKPHTYMTFDPGRS